MWWLEWLIWEKGRCQRLICEGHFVYPRWILFFMKPFEYFGSTHSYLYQTSTNDDHTNHINHLYNFFKYDAQVKGCGEASCDSLFSAPIQGYMFGLLSACLSALAGVYTEYLMKKNNDTLYWQNVQLYTYIPLSVVSCVCVCTFVNLSFSANRSKRFIKYWVVRYYQLPSLHFTVRFGAIFNMARLMMDDFRVGFENGPWWQRLLNGYTVTTWLVVLNLGSSGLLVSWLMKYADNIVKVSPVYFLLRLCMWKWFSVLHVQCSNQWHA